MIIVNNGLFAIHFGLIVQGLVTNKGVAELTEEDWQDAVNLAGEMTQLIEEYYGDRDNSN